MFDDVKDIPDSGQIIDDAPTTEDIFIDDELFSDTDTKDTKNIVGVIKQEIDVNDILFDHVAIDTMPNVPPPPNYNSDVETDDVSDAQQPIKIV